MGTYTIKLTERQMFLLMEGTNKLTASIYRDVPLNLSSKLSNAVKGIDAELDELRRVLVNAQTDK